MNKGIASIIPVFKKKINFKSVNSQTLFNIISMIIRGGISYLTMPVFTRLLGAEQYGMFSIYLSWCGIFTCFMGLQCSASLGTRFYKHKDYNDYKAGLFSFSLLTSFILLVLAISFTGQIERLIELPKSVVIMMLFDSITTFILAYASNGWIYEKKAQKNMMVAFINALLSVSISIFLIYIWRSDNLYIARAVGNFIPALFISFIISIEIFRGGSPKLNSEYIKYGLRFGIPILFHMLSQYILAHSDRLMMQKMGVSKADIGIYSFVYGFSMILSTILSALGNGWTPYLYDGLKEKKYRETNKSIANYVQLFTILSVGFLLVSKEVGEIFGSEEFWVGLKLIPLFVLSVYCIFIYQFAVSYEIYMEHPKYVALMTVLAAVINIFLNWVMIPSMGVFGASLATLVSYIFLALFHFSIINMWKFEKYPLNMTSILAGIIAVATAVILFFVLYDLWIIRWILAALLGIYLIVKIKGRRSIF